MHLKINPQKILPLITIVVLVFTPLFMAQASTIQTQASTIQLTTTSEYTNYVQSYINSNQGNYTYVEKPIFPVQINSSQIAIGGNWTIICPLQEGHNYHIYCYGAWINTSSQAKTDYDFYVYDPQGNLVSIHTESAGLPPHLGTTTDDPLFTPTQSGNYSFVIVNNPVDSVSAQQATFMIIENLECDTWYTSYVEGTNDSNLSFYTNWAYEFVTNASHVNLYIKVPETLDMYEARLYLMNNASSTANSTSLNSFPLPWEPGLYGNLSSSVGGYNFESEGYRGVAYASCEHNGQAMFLNYTSPNNGTKLYQLALIGEYGSGNIQFMLKTDFENESLTPLTFPSRVYPDNATEIAFTSNETNLDTAQLSYTTDNWTITNTVNMDISNQTCNATIPGQQAGSLVQYQIQAIDVLENSLRASGNYTVKEPLTLNITAVKDKIRLGENITINGVLTPNDDNSKVEVQFSNINSTQTINCTVNSDGTFVATFRPDSSGQWAVSAISPETKTAYSGDSLQIMITVTPPPLYVKYSLFIIAGFVAAMAAGGVVYFLKFRGK
jgi:hypothetical protein